MTSLASGDFVLFTRTEDESAPVEVGLVVRTSANDKADGSKDEFVELVPLPDHILVTEAQCRKFDEVPEEDGSAVVGSSSGEVKGVTKAPNKAVTK